MMLAHGRFVQGSSRNVLAFGLGRREALSLASGAVIGGLSLSPPAFADESIKDESRPSFLAYSITPDASETLMPSIKSIEVRASLPCMFRSESCSVDNPAESLITHLLNPLTVL